MRRSHILLALSLITLGASAQKLSPAAEVLLEKKQAAQPRVKLSAKGTSSEVSTDFVSAFITAPDTDAAIAALRSLGVKVNTATAESGLITADIPLDALRDVAALQVIDYVEIGSDVHLLMDYARRKAGVDNIHDPLPGSPLPQPYTGKGIVVGVIDTGVEYAHNAFFDLETGTNYRIKAVWDQNTQGGGSPEGFNYGTEFTTQESIIARQFDSAGEYHGSHTMGIAAGADIWGDYYGVAPEADLVFVSFRESNTDIADAIKYIFRYADQVGKPCVINMSLGSHTGPHNGTSKLDRYIDSVTGPGRIIVGACGNEAESNLHATKTFTDTDKKLQTLLAFSPSISHKYHYVDIWGTTGNLKVKIAVVNSLKGQVVTSSEAFDTSNPDQGTIIKVFYYDENGADCTAYIRGEISPDNGQPHVWVESTVSSLSTGRMIGLIVEGDEGCKVDMWNYSMHEFAGIAGKSAWTPGDNNVTVGEIGGTANNIITVGSFDGRDRIPWLTGGYTPMSEAGMPYSQGDVSAFSSRGPTADGRLAPHILADGMPVIAPLNKFYATYNNIPLQQISSAATTVAGRTSYYAYNMGTSMSAPFVAGTVALMLEANPELTPIQAREILQRTANTDEFMGTLPNNTYGYGQINSLQAVIAASGQLGAIGAVSPDAGLRAVYNPATRTVEIVNPTGASATLYVYAASGALVYSAEVSAGNQSSVKLPDNLPAGIYVASLRTPSQSSNIKIAIK